MARAKGGNPLHFGIIGGSLSRGHACKCTVFHKQIFDWWNETFPNPGNEYVDGSVGARGSSYFKFCISEHLRQNADFIIIELGINDLLIEEHMINMESILRNVLSFPSKPAVILTASFSLMDKIQMGADGHLPVAQYYDVPVISLRNALLPIIQRYPKKIEDYFVFYDPVFPEVADLLHLKAIGHRVLAETTIAFLKRQKCILEHGRLEMKQNETLFPTGEDYSDSVPRLTLFKSRWSNTTVSPIVRPHCASVDNPADPLRALPSTFGWELAPYPHVKKRAYHSTRVGSQIDFEIEVVEGWVQISYERSRRHGLGRVRCWFDDEDEMSGKILDGWWEIKAVQPSVTEVNTSPISPGKHIMHCKLLEKYNEEEGRGTLFMLIAVLTM
ncbi:hypothetical protein EXIGLDRAFT_831031 [Exidia glandulosa HHB12029]|uniref:SGNH hydrolase-type esterase domain-containing protein n=1 Tax=Exidia glandulosa HHB12029 TaxID=1314781 RepID=A0A165MYP3_EXIGL|nr:hypothetical protein EXIGLDRAFT_831031 [Exidia glandulosa HHB12029]